MGYDIVTLEECASWHSVIEVPSSSADRPAYKVQFYGPEGGAFCPCAAFKYSGAKHDCKHISKAFTEIGCFWHQQWSDEKLEQSGVCPRCGGETIYVRCAV
jgi:hypothetical protein